MPIGEPETALRSGLLARDERVFGLVFDRYGELVFGIARRVVRHADVAEDVTQQVFVELWRNPDRFMSNSSLRVCLATLAHSRAVDAVRKETRLFARDRRSLSGDSMAEMNDIATLVIGEAESEARRQTVVRAVTMLEPKCRQALELAYWEGHTYREVAQILEIPEGTAKARLRSALHQLAVLISPTIDEYAVR